jgi:hypothetical protein
MTMPFNEEENGVTWYYPSFKFLSYEHASKLIAKGSIRIPPIHEFRANYGGLIQDAREGLLTITDTPPVEIDLGHYHCYCMTQHLLSDSFEWALREGKETAVMLIDTETVIYRINRHIANHGYTFLNASPCGYVAQHDRIFTPQDCSPDIVKNPLMVAFLKPNSYIAQREVRAIWEKNNATTDIFEIPDIAEFCFPVMFHAVEKRAYLQNPRHPIGIRVGIRSRLATNGPYPEYVLPSPSEVFTPILAQEPTGVSFGIWMTNNSVTGMRISNAPVGVTFMGRKALLLSVPLGELVFLELFTP